MGSSSIDFSLANIWKCWYLFRRGKKLSRELDIFTFYLEGNLFKLYEDLNTGNYRHGDYRRFTVTDNKKRVISVASIRDRIVHRLLYEYLVQIYNKTFIFDVWSCRKDKGLFGAIERTQKFLLAHHSGFVWRVDITKFFDNVDQAVLFSLLQKRVNNEKALTILKEVIASFAAPVRATKCGIPIGNLTSQIFANIYLNEFDRFAVHILKPQAYLRYGDDFIIFAENKKSLIAMREKTKQFLQKTFALR